MKTSHKILLLFVAIAVTFTAGRYSKPTKIETKEVVKTVTVKEEAKTRVVYRDRVIKPDGLKKMLISQKTKVRLCLASVAEVAVPLVIN